MIHPRKYGSGQNIGLTATRRQAPLVAKARGSDEKRLPNWSGYTSGIGSSAFSENPRCNVLRLNMALDAIH